MPHPPKDRPWVTANFAITWDGRISTRNRTPATFTSREDKRRLLEIRALADAVLVSARTAGSDHMAIGMPSAKLRAERKERRQKPYPLRVLISNSGRISPELPLWDKKTAPVVIFSTTRMPRRTRALLKERAALNLDDGDTVDLAGMMHALRCNYNVARMHCEGGGELFRSLIAARLIDEFFLTLSPRIFGGAKAPTLTGLAGDFLPESTRCRLVEHEQIRDECFLRYRVTAQ